MNQTIRVLAAAALSTLSMASFAAGSVSAWREVTVDRPPATVWKLLGEFNALDVWLPGILGSTAKISTAYAGTAPAAGSTRLLDLGGGQTISEELVAYSADKRSYSYAILKSPLPIKNYVSTIELHDAPEGKTLIKWKSTFEAVGTTDDKAREAILGIYDAGLAKLQATFKK